MAVCEKLFYQEARSVRVGVVWGKRDPTGVSSILISEAGMPDYSERNLYWIFLMAIFREFGDIQDFFFFF